MMPSARHVIGRRFKSSRIERRIRVYEEAPGFGPDPRQVSRQAFTQVTMFQVKHCDLYKMPAVDDTQAAPPPRPLHRSAVTAVVVGTLRSPRDGSRSVVTTVV